MRIIPETVGVMMRRNMEIRYEKINWKRADATTRLRSRDAPPAARASTLTAMAADVGPTKRT